MIPKQIFRAYDIRGVYGEDLTDDIGLRLGRAIASYAGTEDQDFVLGRDVRISSKPFGDAVVEGLLSGGINVQDIGQVTTPLLYFTTMHSKKKGGVMITASHNPPEWNGIKILLDSRFIGLGMGMEKLEEIAAKADFQKTSGGKLLRNAHAISDYENYVTAKIDIQRKIRVVADPGNGCCSIIIPSLYKKVGIDVNTINGVPDGTFPAHSPEPNESTMWEVKKLVAEGTYDFGVGFDGDGDRVIFADDRGRLVPDGVVQVMLTEYYLKKEKGAPIVYEVSCSMSVEETIEAHGGKPVLSRVGHTYIGEMMKKWDAPFGGETSGHFYFMDVYGFDDALYASLKMAEILSKEDRKLSEIVDSTPKYPRIPGKKYGCADERKFEVVNKLTDHFRSMGYETVTIDGVKVLEDEGWFLIRASNTQPIIRLTVEAKTQKDLRRLADFAGETILEATGNC